MHYKRIIASFLSGILSKEEWTGWLLERR